MGLFSIARGTQPPSGQAISLEHLLILGASQRRDEGPCSDEHPLLEAVFVLPSPGGEPGLLLGPGLL